MAGNFIALCNENEEAPLVVIAGRETFVTSLLTRIGYGGQFCCDAHRGALNVLPMTARHPVSCPSMCGEDQIRGSMRCGISGPFGPPTMSPIMAVMSGTLARRPTACNDRWRYSKR